VPPTQATAPGPYFLAGAFRVIDIVKAVAAPVADEIAVHGFMQPGFQADHFPVFCTAHDVAAQGAMEAERRSPLEMPAPALETGGFIGVHPGGADVDEIAGKGALQGAIAEAAEVGAVADLHGPEVPVAGKLLVEAAAAPALNASVHFMLDKQAQLLVLIGPFGA
jgi:hypothetical protein